jgi:F0F1-type ATP synthase membrane subunit c/vacuolar-type H+-ATPase subunit K
MGKNPELSNFFLLLTILGIALVESAAIYGLLIALNIVNADPTMITAYQALGA